MHILSPETDNYPSWINGRERITVENISYSISTKECCRPQRGLYPRPSGLQSNGDPTEPPRPATLAKSMGTGNGTPWNHFCGHSPSSDSRPQWLSWMRRPTGDQEVVGSTPAVWPRWLSWMRRPTGDQEVAGSTPAEVGNILSWRLIMKYFLRSFSPFRWFKKGSCQFLAKECAQYWLTA